MNVHLREHWCVLIVQHSCVSMYCLVHVLLVVPVYVCALVLGSIEFFKIRILVSLISQSLQITRYIAAETLALSTYTNI